MNTDLLLIVLIKYGAAHHDPFHCKEAKKEKKKTCPFQKKFSSFVSASYKGFLHNDRIGTRNIVLELISIEIDPSKPAFHNSPFESFSFSSQVSKIDHYITKRSFNFLLSF